MVIKHGPRITSVTDLVKEIVACNQATTIYRGVNHSEYLLQPKIGRVKLTDINNKQKPLTVAEKEESLFRKFKQQARILLRDNRESLHEDWELLAIAQHHGLATRLLDWSKNALVAAYFAVEKEHEESSHGGSRYSGDSAIYVLKILDSKFYLNVSGDNISPEYNDGPFRCNKTGLFIPANITQRIIAQSGVFTFQPDYQMPDFGLTDDNDSPLFKLEKWDIPSKYRCDIKKQLHALGINRASLFPDLDNMARHIMWLRTNAYD
jgi:hypothetical protein